jgi:tetratricopeptide (TPR) repeat protein
MSLIIRKVSIKRGPNTISHLLIGLLVVLSSCREGNEVPPQTDPLLSRKTDLPEDPLEQAKALQSRGDAAGAIAAYDRLLEDSPENIAALGNRAQLLQAQGQLELALADFNALLTVDPSNFAALTRRANLQATLGLDREALTDYDLLLSHSPNDAVLLNARAATWLRLGDANAALRDINAALKLRPGWDDAILNRANASYLKRDFDGASADYEAILAASPNHSRATNGLGMVKQYGELELAEAERLYRLAVFHDAKNAEAHYNIAYIEAQQGLTLKAIEDFGLAIAADPNYVDAFLNRGLLYMQVRLYEEASQDFEFSAGRRPKDGRSRLLLGWARCEGGLRAEGCIDLAAAKSMGQAEAITMISKYCK